MLALLLEAARLTAIDIAPIALVVVLFQAGVARRRPARLGPMLVGAIHVFVGLTLFRVGLAESLVPMGAALAEQLAVRVVAAEGAWLPYGQLCAFAALLGLTATLIEPALIAVANQVQQLTGGAVRAGPLRLAVAVGMAAGLLGGVLRIASGVPLLPVVAALLLGIALLSWRAPRELVPLALDSGAVATSVVTVPLLVAFGIALARALPGRDPLVDGFGLALMGLLLPMVSVLAFATLSARRTRPIDTGE